MALFDPRNAWGPWTENAPAIDGRGKLAERLEVEFGPFRSASSRRAEMLLAYIYRSITHRVHFLDKASGDLFICAKDLLVEATVTKGWRHAPLLARLPPQQSNLSNAQDATGECCS